jgi:hypothetical protein
MRAAARESRVASHESKAVSRGSKVESRGRRSKVEGLESGGMYGGIRGWGTGRRLLARKPAGRGPSRRVPSMNFLPPLVAVGAGGPPVKEYRSDSERQGNREKAEGIIRGQAVGRCWGRVSGSKGECRKSAPHVAKTTLARPPILRSCSTTSVSEPYPAR